MGIMAMVSNNKKSASWRKKQKRGKIVRAAKGKGKFRHLPKVGEITDAEIITPGMLRKRNTSGRANITLSGKKKRKILKQIKYAEKEKSQMEVAAVTEEKQSEVRDIAMAQPSGSKKATAGKRKGKKKQQKKDNSHDNDVEMEEDEEDQ